MLGYRNVLTGLLSLGLLWSVALVHGQSTPPPPPPAGVARSISPDTIVDHQAALQKQLEELARSGLSAEKIEAERAPLEKRLQLLTALAEALQQRTTYTMQLDMLAHRLKTLEAERLALATQAPRVFADVTEALRAEYSALRQGAQEEIATLQQQASAGEVRLARLPEELERLGTAYTQVEKNLLVAQGATAGAAAQAEVALLALRRQVLEAEIGARKAAQEWLTKRGPLHDALLATAQARLKIFTRDLDTITQALSRALEREQDRLAHTATQLQEQLSRTQDPTAALVLQVRLETVAIRREIADTQQKFRTFTADMHHQERRNTEVKQELDRLTTLVEKFAGGELVAQRLLGGFERLLRERKAYTDAPIKAVQTQRQALAEAIVALDDQLYLFDRQAETRLTGVVTALHALPLAPQEAEMAPVRQALKEQKAVLREQQQALAALDQELTRLLAFHRDYRRLLDESYRLILTQMFWLRDDKPLDLDFVATILAGALPTVQRLVTFVAAVPGRLWASMVRVDYLWFFVVGVGLVLPGMVFGLWVRWQGQVHRALQRAVERERPPGIKLAIVVMLRAALWPGYLVLVAWVHGQLLLPQSPGQADLAQALTHGLYVSALVLCVGLLGWALFRPEGWAQRFWNLSPFLSRVLRRTVVIGSLVSWVLLVPRQILLTAPGEATTAPSSLAMARGLFLLFQLVVVILVGIVARRGSALMMAALARSRERLGLLWRIWPLLYVASLGGFLAIMVLDVLGYRYAAQFVWSRVLESLAVLLGMRLVVVLLFLRGLQKVIDYTFSIGGHVPQSEITPEANAAAERSYTIVSMVGQLILALLTIGLVLELWGVDVFYLVQSPTGALVLSRTLLLALIVGVTIGVIQLSSALADYLLQPKTTARGVTFEAGRKLKTMAPLVQTLIKVGAVFAMVLLVLEQVGVQTAPLLAGVGIFGLAIGFASQSLIKDVINGLFILFEDNVSVGDIATLNNVSGQVEKITLRAVTIRDLGGNVHLIPNSTIEVVTNMTKDFSRYLLDVRVALHEDVDRVIGILRAIDEEMRREVAFRYDMLEPLEVMGLDRFEDSWLVIRARLKTRRMQQWRLGREFNRRLKLAFEAHGIRMPVPRQMFAWDTPANGTPPPLQVPFETPASPRELD